MGLSNVLGKRPIRNKAVKLGDMGKERADMESSGGNTTTKGSAGKFVFRIVGTEVWEHEGSSGSSPRVGKVSTSEEALDVFASAVIVTMSYISNGWNLVLQSIRDVFHSRKAFDFRPIGPERSDLSTKDEISRQQILNTGHLRKGSNHMFCTLEYKSEHC